MKQKSFIELSRIAKKAVERTLDNRLKKLSAKRTAELKKAIRKYYEAKTALDYDLDSQTIMYHELRPTTLQSFLRWSDKNHLTPSIKRNYIRDNGIPLDVQQEQIGWDYGDKTTIQDFVDFILDHPFGSETFDKAVKVQEIREHIKSFTGFVATHKFIDKLNLKFTPNKYTAFDKEVGF